MLRGWGWAVASKGIIAKRVPRSRVARRFIFKPNLQNFGTFWKATEFKLVFDHLLFFVTICFILGQFGIFCDYLLQYHFGIF
jgi:hypothetical protein